ncbi:MAG: SIS domain-containing protein [Actinomycetota bacterium]
MAGELMAAEMSQQAGVASQLMDRREDIVAELRRALPEGCRGIALVARGSSDNAALYGRYLLEAATRRPVSFVAPSLLTLYRVPTDYRGWAAIAISQSGETPEIVSALERLQELGATGIAVTNRPQSPLASAGRAAIYLGAGEERAVPATKTFMAQLIAFGFLAEALGEPPATASQWERVPESIDRVVGDSGPGEEAAGRIGDAVGVISVARGYLFSVALEAALKLKETADILAEGFSSADLRHGPIAVVEPGFPVISFNAPGPVESDMRELEDDLRARGANLLTVGPREGSSLPIPEELPEELTVIPATVRAQQVARSLALQRGLDPDRPEGLTKVTRT